MPNNTIANFKKVAAPETPAEQIEIGLRRANSQKQAQLDSIVDNCNFIIACSHNSDLKLFAATIKRIAETGGEQ